MRGIWLAMMMQVAGPAMAQPWTPQSVPPWDLRLEGLPMPNEFVPFPDCPGMLDRNGIPIFPYARDPRVYGGIYLAVEKRFAPLAKYFFPVLQVQDNRDWVRITRTTRNGVRPVKHVIVSGRDHYLHGEMGSVPVIMKIDKCRGAVLEMSFDKNKVR